MALGIRSSIVGTASGNTLTIDPSTLTYVSGDHLLLLAWGYTSLAAPSGSDVAWTERFSDTQAGPFGNTDIHKAWTAVADASLTSFTVTMGVSDQYGWLLMAIQDTDGIDGTPAAASNTFGGDASPDSPAVTTTVADTLMIASVGAWYSGSGTRSFTPPTGMTEVPNSDQGSWDRYAVASVAVAGTGSTGVKTWTESPDTTSAGEAWIAGSIVFKPAAGGTTEVTKALQLIWHTRESIEETLQLIWNVRDEVTDSLQLVWNVREEITDTLQLIWNVRKEITDTLQLIWNVRKEVTDTLQLIWNVESSITSVTKELQLVWNVRKTIFDTLQLIWNTEGPVTITKTLQLIWNTLRDDGFRQTTFPDISVSTSATSGITIVQFVPTDIELDQV